MALSDLSIRKPVFAWMLMAGLIVFGAISFSKMGISQLPDVDFPVLNVSVAWVGASPETMELAVTDVIEDAVMTVEGIRSVSSTCQEGLSNTTIEFELTRDIDIALQEIQTKIAQAQKRLPNDIDPPVVTKSNPEDQPIFWAAITGPNSLRDKVIHVRDHVKDQITTVAGVGDLRLGGYIDPNMRVSVNATQMRNKQISIEDVISALNQGNTLTPSGYMDKGPHETNVRVMSDASSVNDFQNLVIPSRGGQPIWNIIKIKEVAQVEDGLADVRRITRVNGVSAIGLGVIKQRGSNAVAVARGVKSRIRYLKDSMPGGMSLVNIMDTTRFIEDSTRELVFTLILSALLTSVVCWLFLGTWSSAFNVILAIPTSLIGTFIVLSYLKFTINSFTLLALSLSIGIVVDDAIMVLENIVRHVEKGLDRVRASVVGAREITGAAVAASIAILAIFIPVIFMKGIVGKFFYQFGVAMSVAVMISLLEALTLAPMRCSQFLSPAGETKVGRKVNEIMSELEARYRNLLVRALDRKKTVVFGSLGIFILSIFILGFVKKEFVPAQDQNRFLVSVQTEMGSSLEFTDQVFKEIEKQVKLRPEVENTLSAVGGLQGGLVNQGNLFVTLREPSDRGITAPFKHRPSQQEMMGLVRETIRKVDGVKKVSVIDLSLTGFSSQRGFPIQFQLQGPDWKVLAESTRKMVEQMKASGIMTDVDSDYNPHMPEVKVVPDREKAALRGVAVSTIANTISAMVGSLRVGKYTDSSGHRNDVRVKLLNEFNQDPEDIKRIHVRNNRGEMVALSDVVKLEEEPTMLTISRYNRERAISIFANVAPGKSQTAAMDAIDRIGKDVLPDGYRVVLSGNSQAFKESFDSLLLALGLGILVAYMVLGAQFNSFIHPVTVLLALPFSVTGAFLALFVFGISLNIYSMIGILLLMGIVKKNSILLVDFTNHGRERGLGVRESLLEACPMRLRPILMTSAATVVAAIPAALAIGPGSETTRPMAVVVIGGVSLSTLLTLIVVPCAYSLFARFERKTGDAIQLKQAFN
jgi:HAE1 family hydrophobic/amphiphilic exporter-1